jgi:hypothetical protein
MSWKYGINGFEYYYSNIWAHNMYGRGTKKWPDIPWDTYSFISGPNSYNGDGQLVYPGPDMTPFSSVRLENIRDGIEDYESLFLLRHYVDKARSHAKQDGGLRALIKTAEELLAVPNTIVADRSHYTRDPAQIIRFRKQVSSMIELLKLKFE